MSRLKKLMAVMMLGALLFIFIAPMVLVTSDKTTESGGTDASEGGETGFGPK